MNSEIVVAVSTLLGTAFGALIQYFSQRKSSEEAVERLYQKHSIENRYQRLEKLYLNSEDVRSRLYTYVRTGVGDLEDYEEDVRQPFSDLQEAVEQSRIHLDEDEQSKIDEMVELFHKARADVKHGAEFKDENHRRETLSYPYGVTKEEIETVYEPVSDLLKKKLDPK